MAKSRADLILGLYRMNFEAFNRFAFRELNPGKDLHDSWHVKLMSERLERCARGEIRRLIINIPPRCLKSHTASIAFPTWVLGRDPSKKIMTIAGTRSLVADLNVTADQLLRSGRFRSVFPHLLPGVKPGVLSLPEGGGRMPSIAGKSLIGRGADIIIIDDPMPPMDAKDDCLRAEMHRWYDEEIVQRLNNKRSGVIIVVMQRLHTDDLTAHLLSGCDDWEHLSLPAIASDDETWTLPDGTEVKRVRGEALAPSMEDRENLRERLLQIGAGNFTSQYQQDPRNFDSQDEFRSGAFEVDTGLGFPTTVFMRIPETEFMLREVFDDQDAFAPDRPSDLEEEEQQEMEEFGIIYAQKCDEWFQREFTDRDYDADVGFTSTHPSFIIDEFWPPKKEDD